MRSLEHKLRVEHVKNVPFITIIRAGKGEPENLFFNGGTYGRARMY